MLNKNLPLYIIKKLSEDRSKRLYITGIPLPPPDKATDDIYESSIPGNEESGAESEAMSNAPINHSSTLKQNKTSKRQSEAERVLRLQLSCDSPFLTREEVLSKAGISSGSKTSGIQKYLTGEGLIVVHQLPVGKTGRLIWEPTKQAYTSLLIERPNFESKGGYMHQFVCHRIKKELEKKGWDVQVEYFLANGKAVDLIFRKSCKVGLIEIAISPPMDKEINNIVKNLESGIEHCWFIMAAKDGRMKKNLEKLIDFEIGLNEIRRKIKIVLAGDLIFSNMLERL